MSLISQRVIEQEDAFYGIFLEKAIGFAEGTVSGLLFKPLVTAAAVVTRQKQTRGAMKALSYQIARDQKRNLLPLEYKPGSEV